MTDKPETTELVVALDGPEPWGQLVALRKEAGVIWFKLGPQAMVAPDWPALIAQAYECRIFLDLKLADTRDTTQEAVKRFADSGVAAISTFTEEATIAACAAARGSTLKVWQVLNLSDNVFPDLMRRPLSCAAGAICSGRLAEILECRGTDKVVPGIRLGARDSHGHRWVMDPRDCAQYGVTHAVVGRPIWQATNPIFAARDFMAALGGVHV